MVMAYRHSASSSSASYIDDSVSTGDDSAPASRPSDASYQHTHRTSTPASWYDALASEPPRASDFIIYEAPQRGDTPSEGRSCSQASAYSSVPSDDLPGEDELALAGDMLVYDAESRPQPFRNLYEGPGHQHSRQLIVFIRHFFCGACRDYVKALGHALPRSSRPGVRDTKITIITCCSPSLLSKYEAAKDTPFQMYTDPKRKLFRALGCKRYTLNVGMSRPQYVHTYAAATVLATFRDVGRAKGLDGFRGGSMLQVGGEFLFEGSRPVWCHRMANMRDHVETDLLQQVLQYDASDGDESGLDTGDDAYTEAEGSLYCPGSHETGETSFDMSALRRITEDVKRERESRALGDKYDDDQYPDESGSTDHRPEALRRVTEEFPEEDRVNLGERPSCVPRHRTDD